MNARGVMTIWLFLIGMALIGSLAWIVIQFALPRPEWVSLGRLNEFPPAEKPYAMREVQVFLVHDGQEIVVLDPMNPAPGGAKVNWNLHERSFIDPLRGSWFNLYGIPKRHEGVNSIVEDQSLRRYPVKIENGLVFIELSRSSVIKISAKGD